VADEALYAAKEAGRGAVFLASPGKLDSDPPIFKRIDAGTPPPVRSARSHEPEDGREQQLFGSMVACIQAPGTKAREYRQGSRRRHEIKHWIITEPRTIGDAMSPGMQCRELIEDASARSDGGADLARWVLMRALAAAAQVTLSEIDRIGFVLPIPARAVTTVPGLGEDLMRINALSHMPLRHVTFLLYNVGPVYNSPEILKFRDRLAMSNMGIGFEVRAGTLDVLAPLNHVQYEELHLGRELSRNLKPGTSGYAIVESLLSAADQKGTTVVAAGVEKVDEFKHMGKMGVQRFSGPFINQPEPLPDLLRRIREGREKNVRNLRRAG